MDDFWQIKYNAYMQAIQTLEINTKNAFKVFFPTPGNFKI